MLKFLVFLAFLVAYGLWIWACTKAFGKLQSDAAEGHTFWVNQVLSFLTYGAFFGFIFVLSGLWSWRLLVIFFLANELAILAAMLASFSLGAKPTETYLRATWLAIELNSNRPRLAKAVLWITVAIYLVYPIASGIVFFVHPLFTYAEQMWVVEGTVVYVIFGAYPLQLFSVIPLLTAKNLDEGTRQSIFINQLAGAVPTALFVAVGFWAFRVGASGPDFRGDRHLAVPFSAGYDFNLFVFCAVDSCSFSAGNAAGASAKTGLSETTRHVSCRADWHSRVSDACGLRDQAECASHRDRGLQKRRCERRFGVADQVGIRCGRSSAGLAEGYGSSHAKDRRS